MNDTTSRSLDTTFGSRLVTFPDGRSGLRGGLRVTATPLPDTNGGQPVVDFIASDDTLDRYNEVLCPEGWRLEAYRRNPVFQNAHQYGDIIYTIGKALVTELRTAAWSSDGRSSLFLFQRVQFATDANPIARIAYGLYRGGFLNAVSVGFIPLRWEDGKPGTDCRRRYLEQELLEVSAVGIPANPNALQLGLTAGSIQRSDLCEWMAVLRQSATGQSSAGEWLKLARTLRDL